MDVFTAQLCTDRFQSYSVEHFTENWIEKHFNDDIFLSAVSTYKPETTPVTGYWWHSQLHIMQKFTDKTKKKSWLQVLG